MSGSLEAWGDRQAEFALRDMRRAISAVDLVKRRPAFGQTVVPRPGSVLASPVPGDYDPDPDYFFHWRRDAAIVMNALDRADAEDAARRMADFVDFTAGLNRLDGRAVPPPHVAPAARRHLRPAAELATLHGEALLGEPRFNPDGTLDILQWGRPQHDGPALEALCLLRHGPDGLGPSAAGLVRAALDFVARHCDAPSIDPWEERLGHHYYTRAVQLGALEAGADWAARAGDGDSAGRWRAAADRIAAALDRFWNPAAGLYARSLAGDAPTGEADTAVILGVLHAGRAAGRHSVLDDRAQATLARLEDLFSPLYPLNRRRAPDEAPALGRYAADTYYGGNPWFLATLAAAEFQYRLAGALKAGAALAVTPVNRAFLARLAAPEIPAADPAALAPALVARGDAFLRIVRRHTPPSGEMSEQFGRDTGEPRSARRLAWSYAAFLTAWTARRRALA